MYILKVNENGQKGDNCSLYCWALGEMKS